MKRTFLSTVFILLNLIVFGQGYELKVKVNHLNNDTIILGHHLNQQLIPDDTIALKKGIGTFKGKELKPGGMYFLFLPNKSYFDFLLDKNQKFEIQTDTSDFLNKTTYINSSENTVFIEYQRFLAEMNKKADELKKKLEKDKENEKLKKEVNEEYQRINVQMTEYFNNTVKNNPNIFFTTFLMATKQVEVPKEITDKKQQYYYYKNHFFDNMNVGDPRLLRTPVFEEKIDMYLDQVISQDPDSVIVEVDMLIEKSRTNKELFRYMLVHLFNKYASSQIMTAENVYVHIAEKYYIKEAEWSSEEFIKDLKKKVEEKKGCLIGNKGQNVEYQTLPGDSVLTDVLQKQLKEFKKKGNEIDSSKVDDKEKYDKKVQLLSDYYTKFAGVKKLLDNNEEYTMIWFFSPHCGHCRTETPKFHEKWQEELKGKGVKVVAIYLNEDIAEWSKFCEDIDKWYKFQNEFKLYDWEMGWTLFDPFRKKYDISSSPVLYLLDKDKKIIAKRLGWEQAIEMIQRLQEEKAKEKK